MENCSVPLVVCVLGGRMIGIPHSVIEIIPGHGDERGWRSAGKADTRFQERGGCGSACRKSWTLRYSTFASGGIAKTPKKCCFPLASSHNCSFGHGRSGTSLVIFEVFACLNSLKYAHAGFVACECMCCRSGAVAQSVRAANS